MKQGKHVNMDDGHEKPLQSISCITDHIRIHFEGQFSKQEEEIIEEHLESINSQIESKTNLTEKQLIKSNEIIKKQVFLRLNLANPEKQAAKSSFTPIFRKYTSIAAVFAVLGITYLSVFLSV